MEEQEFEEWKRKENKYILFFDGASRGNPGVVEGGGILVGPKELPKIRFSWGLGIETNNIVEALALWQVLHIIFIIPMTVNDVNLYVAFGGVRGLSS
jgi:ribonuclease HI